MRLGDRVCFQRKNSDIKSTGTVVGIYDTQYPANSFVTIVVDDFDCAAVYFPFYLKKYSVIDPIDNQTERINRYLEAVDRHKNYDESLEAEEIFVNKEKKWVSGKLKL